MDRVDDAVTVPGAQTTPPSEDSSSKSSQWARFTPGTLFAGRFRIVAPLGRGGMGEVYRADDLRLGQTVALKLLPENLSTDPGRLAQFHNEVRVARTIAHRNVCRTYDIGDADGRPFMTMEYVDGEDLAALLRRIGRFPQDRALAISRQVCAGLAAAHECGIVHRDLKPANVMIKVDIVNEVSKIADITKVKAEVAVDAVFDAMRLSMQRGERIELRGFGVFQVKPRKRGIGRNPRTGKEVRIPPGRTIRFKPGKDLQNIGG